MTTITDDRWDKEVWGAATAEGTNNRDTANSNLTFYWGKKVFQLPYSQNPIKSDVTPGQMGSQPYQRCFDRSSGAIK